MANNWDRIFGGTDEVSESDIASAQRRSNGNYARILDKQVRSDPLYRGTKPDALTRLALRNLELDRVAEQSRTVPTGLPYGITPRPSGVPSDAPRMYEGDNTKTSPTLINDALAKSTLAGAGLTFGLNPLVGFRAGLVGSSIPEALIANTTEDAEIPAAMAGAGMLGRRALPTALAAGAAYAADAEAGSKYDPRAFLRYIQQNFPDMLSSAKQGMKFTADTGREAGVYGLLDDSMRIKPRIIVHGSTNSVALPRDVRRELVDSANAFDMHTHPNGNALPSTPLNNASQNALGGDTEYYQKTSRGTPWLRPGKADNLIVSVQPRAIREPLDFGNGRGESWTHMKMNEYPSKQELKSLDDYLVNNADRYENMLPMGDIGMMIPDDLNTFALLKHYADTGRGDFTYNLGKEVFGPGGREPATPMYEAIYDQLRKDRHLRNYAGGGLVKSGLKMMFPNLGAPLHVVKPKGGNWLAGSVEDALRGLRREGMNDVNPEVDSLNRFVEGPLTKYVKTRMASPEDEVRKLAEQGVLHFEPAMIRERSPLMEKVVSRRETAGFPIQGIADAPLARNWENTSDSIIRNLEARDLSSAERAASFGGKSGIPGDTIVHEMNPFASGAGISDLGFPHLIDELSNALNPNSGLPAHLQLTPEAVKNMSMEKAVRRVADINAWRAAQKAEANRKLAEQASIVREYAENNPKGLRWVELKAPENLTPEQQKYYDKLISVQTDPQVAMGAARKYGTNPLADQLKYEGDTMGHCVGGYCDDVISGRSRIFSLRDAKGEPHVTVEVGLQPRNIGQQDIPNNYIDEAMEKLGIDSPESQWGREEEIDRLAGDLWRKDNPDVQRIVQIKGKQNRAPNEEYLPFVQDFVRNSPLGQPWAEVGDLQNTGLRRTIDAFNSNELKKIQEAGIEVPTHATSEELEAINRQIWPDPDVRAGAHPDGFASGGPVEKTSPWSVFSGHNSADWPEEL